MWPNLYSRILKLKKKSKHILKTAWILEFQILSTDKEL